MVMLISMTMSMFARLSMFMIVLHFFAIPFPFGLIVSIRISETRPRLIQSALTA
jgi:hypothetical protein